MAGPTTKPTPNAAPSRPSRRGRSAGEATSVTAACATDTLAARGAVDDATDEQQPQRTGGPGEEAPHGRAEQRQQEDRLATDVVGEAPEERRAHELRQRERGDEHADVEAAGAEVLGVPARIGTTMPKPTRSSATVVQMVANPGG